MSGSEKNVIKNTYDISSSKRVTGGVSGSFTLWPYKTTAKKCTKKVYCTCKVAFLLIRPIVVFHRSRCLSRSALRDFIFCLGKLYRVSQKFVPLISCTTTFDQNFIFTRNF